MRFANKQGWINAVKANHEAVVNIIEEAVLLVFSKTVSYDYGSFSQAVGIAAQYHGMISFGAYIASDAACFFTRGDGIISGSKCCHA